MLRLVIAFTLLAGPATAAGYSCQPQRACTLSGTCDSSPEGTLNFVVEEGDVLLLQGADGSGPRLQPLMTGSQGAKLWQLTNPDVPLVQTVTIAPDLSFLTTVQSGISGGAFDGVIVQGRCEAVE